MSLTRSASLLALLLAGGTLPDMPARASEAQPGSFLAPILPARSLPIEGLGSAMRSPTPRPWALERPKLPAAPAVTSGQDGPNLSALRFYASQNDLARVAAEIRLLRARFPGWEPPADLFADTGNGKSEQPLWDLFAKHDLAGLRAAIEDQRQKTPDWQPSAELATKLTLAEALDVLVRASDAKDFGTVIDTASTADHLMTCATIDAIWRTAEALILTGDEPRGVEAYRYILANCTNSKERLATMQKASQLVKSPEAFDSLLGMGQRLPDGKMEFAEVRLDGIRRRVGEAAANPSLQAPAQADLDALSARARNTGGAADAELMGWYALSRKDFAGAETWFRSALQPGPSAKAAEGLILALRDGGKLPDAIKLAPQYAGLGPLNRKLSMEVLVADMQAATKPPTAEQLMALGAAIEGEKSADAAQSLGWARYKANDFSAAAGWFRKALDWQPSEAAAIGMMVVAKRLGRPTDYAATVTAFKGRYPRVAELEQTFAASQRRTRSARTEGRRSHPHVAHGEGDGWDQTATTIVKTFEGGQIDTALAMMDARRARRPEPKGLSVVRGWALYKKGDREAAAQVFSALKGSRMDDEAQKGLEQIQRGYMRPTFY